METNHLFVEARARIIWGELPSSVRSYLTSNGIPESEANVKTREFSCERNLEVRKLGIRSVLIGVALLGASGGMVYLEYRPSHIGSLNVRGAKGFGMILLAGFYGLYRLVNGIIYLVRPQSGHEEVLNDDF